MKNYLPTSPGVRFRVGSSFDEITTDRPEKTLTESFQKKAGRNSQGRITSRHKGGGHKRRYRTIDFKREKLDVAAKVHSIEYDPNRTARIALLHYLDGEKRYMVAPVGLKVGAHVVSSDKEIEVNPGNALLLKNIPTGTQLYNLEIKPGKGGQMVRSAGSMAQLVAKEGKYVQIKLPSGEVRKFLASCRATIGRVGNVAHANEVLGKAGRTRWKGVRPQTRGTAMNPVDHPHGGGQGQDRGGRNPVTPWGKPTKGFKTRNNKTTDYLIVRRRKK